MSNQNSKPKNKKTKKIEWKAKRIEEEFTQRHRDDRSRPGGDRRRREYQLAAAIVSFELRDGGLLTGVLVLDVENGVVSRDGSNQERR